MLAMCLSAAVTGCHAVDLYTPSLQAPVPPAMEPPRELSMVSLPTYRIEPPDLLRIEVLKLVPRPPCPIEPQDVLQIRVLGALQGEPISGLHLVEGEGNVNLGIPYGMVRVAGMTTAQATEEITRHLKSMLQQADVTVQLARSAAVEQISGLHLVQPDGTLNLGRYGMVHVAGKTVTETTLAVEEQMGHYFDSPRVGVEVAGYYSKDYCVIVAGTFAGEMVTRFPITGNETVLDALGRMGGVSRVSSRTMWVARPAPDAFGAEQILPVDWAAIARGGSTETNYQLLPGDRLFIVDDSLIAINNCVHTFTDPVTRLLSILVLSSDAVRNSQTLGRGYNANR